MRTREEVPDWDVRAAHQADKADGDDENGEHRDDGERLAMTLDEDGDI